MNLKKGMMPIVVKSINCLFLISLLAVCSCGVESVADEGVFFNQSEKSLPDELRNSVAVFFENLKVSNLEKVYDFAASDYRNTVPFDVFQRFYEKKWKLEEVELLSSSIFENSFYIVIRSISKNGHQTTCSYDVMFWRINDREIEFINFPFNASGAPPYGEVPSLFK